MAEATSTFIVIDVRLPGRSGLDFQRELAAANIPAKAGIQVRQGFMDPGSSLRCGRDDNFISQPDVFSTLLV
jgi:hypothetical protein